MATLPEDPDGLLPATSVAFNVTGGFTPVTGFALLDAADGVTRPELGTLGEGATLDLSSTATGAVDIRAEAAAEPTGTGSVVLELRGPRNVRRTVDTGAPWRLFGAGGGALPNGTYTLTATPYTRPGGRGDALNATTVTFTVTGSFEAGAAPVTGFTLVDARGGLPDPDLGALADGARVDLSGTEGLASIRAELAPRRPDVAGVVLALDGVERAHRVAPARAPVSLFGDSGGDYVARVFPPGDYTLTARPADVLRTEGFDEGAAGWTPRGGEWRAADGVYGVELPSTGYGKAVLDGFEAADLVLEADVRATLGGAEDAGVMFRATGARSGKYNFRGYYAGVLPGESKVVVGRMDDGRLRRLGAANTGAAGPWYRLKVAATGKRIDVYVDGALRLEVEDATYGTGGVGLRAERYKARHDPIEWDDVAVTRLDDPDGVLPETAIAFTVGGLSSLSIAAGTAATEGGAAVFTITADPAPAEDLAVAVSVTQGADDDYLPDTLPTSVTIAAGATQATVSVALPDDTLDEVDGIIVATIGASPDYKITTSSASVAVHDNDVPALSIAAGAAATEGGTATFTITANPAPAADLAVAVSVTQGAEDDYLPDTLPMSVTIAAGATEVTVSVILPDDDAVEPDGVVTATIEASPGNYEVTTSSASLTVRDDDVPSLSIAAGAAATEGGTATFTITADQPPAADLAVAVSVTQGTDDDYLPDTPPTSATIAAGATEVTVSVALPDDDVDESSGVVTATITASPGKYDVTTSSASLAVYDDDVPSLSIAAGEAATEGGMASFTITADPPPAADLVVNVSVTEGSDDDYLPDTPPTSVTIAGGATEATLFVTLPDDETVELDGTVTATITESSDYEVTTSSASVTVQDDDVPSLSIAAGEAATEGGAATFTITADQAPGADLSVSVSVTQGANDDYLPDTLPTSVTIAAGATEAALSVTLPDDDTVEPAGVLTATIASSSNYDVTTSSASLAVHDNDVPTLSIAAGEAATEGGTARFTITADQAPGADLAVTVTVTQGANDDYLPDTLPTSVTIAAGASEATLSVALPDDETDEADGVVAATIVASSNYDVTTSSASLAVRDNDVPALSITAGAAATEGGTATFTITAAPAPVSDLAVRVSVTQGSGNDYLPDTVPSSVTIAAGATEATLSVALPDDAVDELDGVVTATIAASSDYAVTTSSASVTVRDDDLLALSITAGPAVTEGGTATFTITADQAAAADLVVSVSVTQGTDDDYLPDTLPSAATIMARTTVATLLVTLPNDAVDEPDGTVTATITASPDYGVTTSSASLTVRDNDVSPVLLIAAGAAVTEGGTATFTIGADQGPAADLVVNVAVTQGADDDYLPDTPPTAVTLAAQTAMATLSVAIPDDDVHEADGVVTATLTDGTGYRVSPTTASASVTVHDNDPPPLEAPSMPFALAIPADRRLYVSWEPGEDGGPVEAWQYRVIRGVTGSEWGPWIELPVEQREVTVRDLENGVSWMVAFRGVNADAEGESVGTGATPRVRPPTAVTATAGHARVQLAWRPHAHAAPDVPWQTRHAAEAATPAERQWSEWIDAPGGATARGVAVTGLVHGTTYVFEVRGVSSAGVSSEHDVSKPVAVTATLGLPALSIAADEAVTEGGTATFTITADRALATDLVVNVSVTQGADDDYLPDTLPTSVTIAAGATTATVSVALPDDDAVEPDGVVTATIAASSDYDITTSSASVAVQDDDVPSLSIAAGGAATEGGRATFTITADQAPLADLAVSVSVTQGADDDYLPDTLPTSVTMTTGATEATLSVALPDDEAEEPDGVIEATIGVSADYEITVASASLTVHDNDAPELTAEFIGVPERHRGKDSEFEFELLFSDFLVQSLSSATLRDDALQATNATVTHARRVVKRDNRHWRITVRPDSAEEVTVTLPATTDCEATGALCTEDGRPLSNSLSATVAVAPLTAEFIDVPEQHWGEGFEFEFELLFSEFLVQKLSSATLREDALRATNATVTHARRVVKKDNRHWTDHGAAGRPGGRGGHASRNDGLRRRRARYARRTAGRCRTACRRRLPRRRR